MYACSRCQMSLFWESWSRSKIMFCLETTVTFLCWGLLKLLGTTDGMTRGLFVQAEKVGWFLCKYFLMGLLAAGLFSVGHLVGQGNTPINIMESMVSSVATHDIPFDLPTKLYNLSQGIYEGGQVQRGPPQSPARSPGTKEMFASNGSVMHSFPSPLPPGSISSLNMSWKGGGVHLPMGGPHLLRDHNNPIPLFVQDRSKLEWWNWGVPLRDRPPVERAGYTSTADSFPVPSSPAGKKPFDDG